VAAETIALIREMAAANRQWDAERIRGELLKLGIRASKRMIQKYARQAARPRPPGQRWATFLRNHAHETWACDFLPVTDLVFRPVFAFFLVELGSRRVVHVGVTRHPTDAWVAQQLREATPHGACPRLLVRDNDAKYGPRCAQLAAPRANAVAERFLRSVRRECLDHVLLLDEAHLRRVLGEDVASYNQARPHQGLGQRVPGAGVSPGPARHAAGHIVAIPVLGGLHHTYVRAARGGCRPAQVRSGRR